MKKYNKKLKATEIETKLKADKRRNHIIISLLMIFTFLLFARSVKFEFVNWDDNSYILDNLLIRYFSPAGWWDIFTTPVIGMYNPLVFFIYALEYMISGLNPFTFHLVNILCHVVATFATYKFIYELTKRYETATIVTLFFAIHPMHVSVITWVSETKTSLMVIFYMFALVNYLKYIRSNYKIKYLICTGLFFILALLSKPSAVTLAPMLFLLDYYLSRSLDKRMIVEKLPFFLVSLFFGILTIMTHVNAEDSIFDTNQDYSLFNNILVSNYALVFYINKLFLPFELCTIYPYPPDTTFLPFKYYPSLLVIPVIIWLIYKSGKFRKEMIFGVMFFVIAISVLLRIVPTGFFRASNVYSYLSYTGLFFIIGQFFTYVQDNKLPYARKIKDSVLIVLIGLTIVYFWRANVRINVYENSITLFDDVIKKKPKLAIAYNNRGVAKLLKGDVQGCLDDLSKCIEVDPKYSGAYNNRGKIYIDLKRYDEALQDLNKAIAINPKYAEAYLNRGNLQFYLSRYSESLADFSVAIYFNPDVAATYRNRGVVKQSIKNDTGALKDFDMALELDPQYYDAYIDRSKVKYKQGKAADVVKDCNAALELNPKSSEAYYYRGLAKSLQNNQEGARQDIDMAEGLGFKVAGTPD